MKLTRIVILHDWEYHLLKNWGVSHRVQEDVVEKPLKTSNKMSCFAQF